MIKIPFLRLDRQYKEIKNKVVEAIDRVLSSGNVLQGVETKIFEENLSKIFNLKYCVSVNSGTDALSFALSSLNLKPGSKIAVPAMSFIASASIILQNKHIPVFVDIDQSTMLMDENIVTNLINEKKVDAIIFVHLYGQMQPLEKIFPLAKKNNIKIIEDAAQAMGATRNNLAPGKYSDLTCVSFDPTKVIGAYGSGGAVLTNSFSCYDWIKLLRYHGNKDGKSVITGYNSQLAEIQAAILNIKLGYLDIWQTQRIKIANHYFDGLSNLKNLKFFKILKKNVHNFHKFVMICEDRNELIKHLNNKGIQTKIHYPLPLHRHLQFKDLKNNFHLKEVEQLSKKIISLPIYPELYEKEINEIIKEINNFYT